MREHFGFKRILEALALSFISLLSALSFADTVRAASIAFRANGTPSANGRVELLIYFEDPSRQVPVNALQVDVDLQAGARLASVYPNTYGPGGANSNVETEDGTFIGPFPWDLSNTAGYSPSPPNDNLVIGAARFLFDVNQYAETIALFSGGTCLPTATCALQREASAQNRILLARFDVFWDGLVDPQLGPGFFVAINNLQGNPEAIDLLRPLQGLQTFVPVLTPEPAALVLLSAVLGLLGGIRRSS